MEIISVWGNPGGGKTTLSLELAKNIIKETNENCILVFCEDQGSPINFLFPELEKEGGSLGKIITSAGFYQDELKRTLVNHSKNKQLGFLGYRNQETKLTFPAVTESQVIDLFISLGQIVKDGYIIVDCKSDFTNDYMTQYALNEGQCLMVGGGDLKSIAFFNSMGQIMEDFHGFREKKTIIANNPWDFHSWQLVADKYGKTQYYFPYCTDVQKAYLEERSIDELVKSKNNKLFIEEMHALTVSLLGIESMSNAKGRRQKKEKRSKQRRYKKVEVTE
jgi:hypothetical protein